MRENVTCTYRFDYQGISDNPRFVTKLEEQQCRNIERMKGKTLRSGYVVTGVDTYKWPEVTITAHRDLLPSFDVNQGHAV